MHKLAGLAKTFISERGGKLSIPQQHQLRIALKTLKMSDVGTSVMGGMSKQEAIEFLKSIGYSPQKIKKLSEDAPYQNDRETDMVSDISQTWTDPNEIAQDVREYLMMLFQEQAEDYKIEDAINAIEQGIQEFRKITNV